jgi:hypothetical protein
MRPWTPPRDGLSRDKVIQRGTERKRPLAEVLQLAGRFRSVWQVMGSNHRRLSRRFYRPPSSSLSHMPLTYAYAFRDAVPGRRRPLCVRAPPRFGFAQPTDLGVARTSPGVIAVRTAFSTLPATR